MFVGMENITLSKYTLADEALKAAQTICDCDPLLMGELGVMAFNHGQYEHPLFWRILTHSAFCRYEKGLALFRETLDLAQVTKNSEKSWATTYLNLGTCFRKLKQVHPLN